MTKLGALLVAVLTAGAIWLVPNTWKSWVITGCLFIALGAIMDWHDNTRIKRLHSHALPIWNYIFGSAALGAVGGWRCGAAGWGILGCAVGGVAITIISALLIGTLLDRTKLPSGRPI